MNNKIAAMSEHRKIDIQRINHLVNGSREMLIAEAEGYYAAQLNTATETIMSNRDASILLTSGPSGSTKTTTSNKLATRLGREGVHCVVISLDDFFVDRDTLPHLPSGEVDYESTNTLDLVTLRRCFNELIHDRVSNLPLFDFKTGKRSLESRRVVLNDNTLAIVEGIHALNPALTEDMAEEGYLKLYVSPHSDYYLGEELVLSSRNTRFIRRLVRDFFHRSNSIERTMQMWPNVVRSEVENIIPFRPYSDIQIDSTIIYEPCIYASYLLELIKGESLNERDSQRMEDLLTSLSHFSPLPPEIVPKDTVLREFLA